MFDMERQKLLEQGKATLNVTVAGMRQRQDFMLEREETPYGKVPFLTCTRVLPLHELLKISEEFQLPVKCAGQKVFPKGKSPRDFAGQ